MRLNRTLVEMRAQVTRRLNDTISATFAEESIDAELQSGLETLCNLLVDDNRGQRCLRKLSDSIAITADQKDYLIPLDCLRIEKVQYSVTSGSDVEWYDLTYGTSSGIETIHSGSALQFASLAARGTPECWTDDADLNGYVRLYPTPGATAENIRFVYYAIPEFPEEIPGTAPAWLLGSNPCTSYTALQYVTNDGTYYQCTGSHTASAATEPGTGASWETVWKKIYLRLEGVPVGFDTLIEYLAIATLALEELEDGKPIGAFGQQFRQKYSEIVGGPAGGQVRPQRRYVNMV